MEDFEVLAQESKDRGLKIVMDFVPNHSSNEHEWFLKSEQREDPYTDYYIWKDRNESNPGIIICLKIVIVVGLGLGSGVVARNSAN